MKVAVDVSEIYHIMFLFADKDLGFRTYQTDGYNINVCNLVLSAILEIGRDVSIGDANSLAVSLIWSRLASDGQLTIPLDIFTNMVMELKPKIDIVVGDYNQDITILNINNHLAIIDIK